MEQRKLSINLFFFLLFTLVLIYIVMINAPWANYYSTEVVRNMVVHGYYTQTIPFTEVNSYDQFIEYLNETLFPVLYGTPESLAGYRHDDYHRDKRETRNSTGHPTRLNYTHAWDEESMKEARRRFLRHDDHVHQFVGVKDRSWTMDFAIKLIGKPRIRQLRVKNNTCAGTSYIVPRLNLCFSVFTMATEEKGDFNLWWDGDADKSLTPKERKPWSYTDPWESGATFLVAKHSTYPAGGYILDLAKNINDSIIVLNYMDAFQWINAGTRAIIIEFTLYCVNVNLFNIVHLIAEKTASGFIVPSYQIETHRFVFLAGELETFSILMTFSFYMMLICYLLRECNRIKRTSFLSYICRGRPTIDLLLIILGLVSILLLFLKNYYVSELLQRLINSQNYEYVSFSYASIFNVLSRYVSAILVVLVAVKLLQLLRFGVIFHQMQEVIRGSFRYFVALSVHLLLILIAFSIFFHLLLLPFEYGFSSIGLTLSTLVGRAFCLDHNTDSTVFTNTPWFIGPLFYGVFVSFVILLIYSFFVATMCFYLNRVKEVPIKPKYNAFSYIKHVLTANKNSDILRLRGGCSDTNQPLRLRGGGQSFARCFLKSRDQHIISPEKLRDEDTVYKRKPRFSKLKAFDFTIGSKVDMYRFEVMKTLAKGHLRKEIIGEKIGKETMMKIIVARHIVKKKKLLIRDYYLVLDTDGTSLVPNRKLLEIHQVIEEYGIIKLKEAYKRSGKEVIIVGDIKNIPGTVKALDKKVLGLLELISHRRRDGRGKRIGSTLSDDS
ncbi:UNVERIFIED_CONTAM: hypothetical protein PYX00_007942 [Menopon gallinae]